MFPYKIFKRVLRQTFPKVHEKPSLAGVQRYVTDFEGFDGSPDDPYYVCAFRFGGADFTLEFRSSLMWVSVDKYGTETGYVTLWEGSAK